MLTRSTIRGACYIRATIGLLYVRWGFTRRPCQMRVAQDGIWLWLWLLVFGLWSAVFGEGGRTGDQKWRAVRAGLAGVGSSVFTLCVGACYSCSVRKKPELAR